MSEPATLVSMEQAGSHIRERRRARGESLRQTAARAGVGPRFLSELERGKPTAELGKVLAVLDSLDLALCISLRDQAAPAGGFSRLLGTDFPYDWSNSRMDADTFIHKVLQSGRYDDLLRSVDHFGFDHVARLARELEEPLKSKVTGQLTRILRGMLMAQPVDAHAS